MSEVAVRVVVLVGSVREGRYGPRVARWLVRALEQRGDVAVDVVDLAGTPLPIVQQAHPVPTGEYASAEVRAFAARIGAADAFVVVTPEYNRSFPGPLKLAIDSVHPEWAAKPVGFVSYGGVSRGLRAVEHLRAVFAELHATTVRETVSFDLAEDPLDEDGTPRNPARASAAADALMDQLLWWARTLRSGRSTCPYGSRTSRTTSTGARGGGHQLHRPVHEHGPTRVLAALLLASMLTIMAGATISPALPAMTEHFSRVDDVELVARLVLTVTALAIAVTAPLAGTVVDRYGRKPVLVSSAVLYGVAGGAGLVMPSLYAILASRALLGAAVAGVMTAATALIADLYRGAARSRVLGLQSTFMGAGGVVFLSLGGLLADVHWRGPFAIYLLALPLAVLVLWAVPGVRVTQAAWQRTPGHRVGEDGPVEDVYPTPARFPLATVGIFVLALAAQVAFFTVPTQLPFHLAELLGMGGSGTGLTIAWMVAVGAAVGLGYGKVSRRLAHAHVARASFGLMALGLAGVGVAADLVTVVAALTTFGVGVGLVLPNLNAWVTSVTPAQLRGRALGGLVSAMFLGQFLSPVLVQPVVNAAGLDAAYLGASALAAVAGLAVAGPGAAATSSEQDRARAPH